MPTEKLIRGNNLYESFDKINEAIEVAGQAGFDASRAIAQMESIRKELDTIVVAGDSGPEAAQARVDETNKVHATLKARIDDGIKKVTSQIGASTVEVERARVDEGGTTHKSLKERVDKIALEMPEPGSITPRHFKAAGNGTTNDNTAFTNLENVYNGALIDLEGKTYVVTVPFNKNFYINGKFIYNGVTYEAPYGLVKQSGANTFVGENSGSKNNPFAWYLGAGGGYANVGIGTDTLKNNVRGWRNVAIGWSAMRDNIEGTSNVGIGDSALERNIGQPDPAGGLDLGSRNTAVGSYALRYNKTGLGNIGIGRNAAHANETGNYNTAVGTNSYSGSVQDGNNTDPKSANFNVAIGYNALFSTNGDENVGVGHHTGYRNVTGVRNTYVGSNAGRDGTDGNRNVALGYQALMEKNIGSDNTAIGTNALGNMQTVNSSTAIGDNALMFDVAGAPLASGDYVIGIGKQSRVSGNNQVQIGTSSQTTYAYGAIQNRSDERDKADIKDTELGLENFITKLRPVDFKWNYRDDYVEFYEEVETRTVEETISVEKQDENGETYFEEEQILVEREFTVTKTRELENDGSKKRKRYHHGFIAQEVQKVIEETGIDFGGFQDHSINGGNDVLSVGYEELIGPLVRSVQELNQKHNEFVMPLIKTVQELSARVKELEGKSS